MKHLTVWLSYGFLFIGLIFGGSLWADGLIIIEPPWPLPPRPNPHYAFAPLEVKYHHVDVRITEQAAVTEVDQSFYNPNAQRLEGTYIFPIPNGAQIDKFSMDIDGKMMDAELLDADKARQIYEDIVRRMKDPALLEYAGQGMFKLRIYPIEPRAEKKIKLKYTQLLKSEDGLAQYLYPLNTEKFSAQFLQSVSVKVTLKTSRPLKSVYSPSHSIDVQKHGDFEAVVGYEAKNVKPNTDFQLFFLSETGKDLGISLLPYNEGDDPEGGYFLLLLSPSAQVSSDKVVKKDVVFVVDSSGSMADGDKIDQAKRALRFCLKNLNEGDRFEVVRFSTEAEPLFGKLVDLSSDNLAKAESFVSQMKPVGGTAIEDALTKAVEPAKRQAEKDRPYQVIFLTDGVPTIGKTNDEEILKDAAKEIGDLPIRLFSFGIGTDVNTHLLDKLSEQTRAVSAYVLPKEDIEVKVSNFYAKISEPVLTASRLTATGAVKLSKLEPALLPDLFKGEQLIVSGRYSGSGGSAITVEGKVNGETRSYVYETTFPAKAAEYAFVPKLWAARRVGFLLDQIRLHGENRELRTEVTELARRYGIVTPYTAYLVVEDETRRAIPLERQSLKSFAAGDMETEGRLMYENAGKDKEGWGAVGDAQAMRALRGGTALEAPAAANKLAMDAQIAGGAKNARRIDEALQSQQARFIRGRTFYPNGAEWIDANVQSHQDAKRVQVKFNSAEYFALLRRHPDMPQWLSVGQNVQLYFNKQILEVN